MKQINLFAVAAVLLLMAAQPSLSAPIPSNPPPPVVIWPAPVSLQYTTSDPATLFLPPTFEFSCATSVCPDELQAAFQRYLQLIFFAGPPSSPVPAGGNVLASVSVKVGQAVPLAFGVDESYGFDIETAGATITANTQWGAIRALESFAQTVVWNTTSPSTIYSISNVPISVSDAPRYPWRGVLVDSSRHFLTVATLLKILDAMSYNKFNVLHWHVIDSDSFPLESQKYPNFTLQGAFTVHSIYTPTDVQTIITHATQLGILVVPEFDTPAHADIWGLAYPQVVTSCADGQTLIDPTGPAYPVIQGLFEEFSTVFSTPFYHLGGDEVQNYNCWDEIQHVIEFKNQHNFTDFQLRNYYETQIQNITNSVNKIPMFWEEVYDGGFDLQPNAIINVWLSSDKTVEIVKAGFRAVHSYGWYLDVQDPPGPSHWLWGDTWENFYVNTITGNATLSPAEEARVLGGEASQWGEQVDSTNIFSRMWPRACATAEALWSPAQNLTDEVRARFEYQRCNIVRRGISAGPIRPGDVYLNCELPPNSVFAQYH